MSNQSSSWVSPDQSFEIKSTDAWASLPGFVRFAVWLWAIGTVLSLVAGALVGVVFVLAST